MSRFWENLDLEIRTGRTGRFEETILTSLTKVEQISNLENNILTSVQDKYTFSEHLPLQMWTYCVKPLFALK